MRQRLVLLLLLLVSPGCADRASDEAPTADAPSLRGPSDETRIPRSPTAEDELPSAILGTAPPPRGFEVGYWCADPATSGYLAVPEGDGLSPEDVQRFVEALRAAGVPNDVHVYDAVDHGFWLYVDEDPDVRREPALDAWQRLKAYLTRTLR